ncbi:hypothetical protein O9G_002877 [Rozella allomycis CSF55]|uniref:SET domain-containing protein n=1 Tax=Rozella allomycis (strain CSF55) TaxID=988480 RepID=A0A075AS62_ROZAC|nr:hypothetical protein O9G_002877 [Rozella allomycis CSF55]|eukprot:EPZ33076.1 hypothetical protein O9G_002877 [Rozella allomycis CSF55]
MDIFKTYFEFKEGRSCMLKVPVFAYFLRVINVAGLYDDSQNVLKECTLKDFDEAVVKSFYKNRIQQKMKTDLRKFHDYFLSTNRVVTLTKIQGRWGVVSLVKVAQNEICMPLWTRHLFDSSLFKTLPPHVVKKHPKRGDLFFMFDGPGVFVNHNSAPLNNCTWREEKGPYKKQRIIRNIVQLDKMTELRVSYEGELYVQEDDADA